MVKIITLIDETIEILMGIEDFYALLDERLGHEATVYLKEQLQEYFEEQREIEERERSVRVQIAHYQKVMRELRKLSRELSDLIIKKNLNRRKISNTAGKIGVITGREPR